MILSARQISPVRLPKPTNPVARLGLSFQHKFAKRLKETAPKGVTVVSEPWFQYEKPTTGSAICSPDILIHDGTFGYYIVIEVKLTWTPLALEKLRGLYCPVVRRAFGEGATPVVVCKNLLPESPRPASRLSIAATRHDPLFQWLGREPIAW